MSNVRSGAENIGFPQPFKYRDLAPPIFEFTTQNNQGQTACCMRAVHQNSKKKTFKVKYIIIKTKDKTWG